MLSMIRDPGRQNGKQKCVLPSAQSITVPSWATGCNGARTGSKTARGVSAFVCRWASLARADSPVNFGGTGSNARSRIGILAGLFLVRERILPIVMYTGQAFLSPEKLVRCVWSDNPIMGTTVDRWAKFSTKERNWLLGLETPLPRPVRTYLIPVYPTTSPPYASRNIIAPHSHHILE